MLRQTTDKYDPYVQTEKKNSWYVEDQFKQLDQPGTRIVIEQRWKYFADALTHYLKNRISSGGKEPLRYLDAGCGDGVNLKWAAEFFRKECIDIRVTGLDYNSLRVKRVAQNRLAEDIHLGSLLETPFNNATFDIVLCSHVLEHIEQYHKALAEIMRVLKPGGLLVVGVPNEGCLLGWLRNRVIQRSILKKTDHVNFFNSKTINQALQNAGFNVVRVYREGFFVPHTWAHYALTYFAFGSRLLSLIGKMFPSQSGGLILSAVKPITYACLSCKPKK